MCQTVGVHACVCVCVCVLLLLLLLNLYSTHHMLTPRGALHYKVKISQWATGRCYTLP